MSGVKSDQGNGAETPALARCEALVDRLAQQSARLTSALNTMNQALCMFDAEQRLIVCNERYGHMFALSDELMQPGTHVRDIIAHRIARGIYPGNDPQAYANERLRIATAGKPSKTLLEFKDGRVFSVAHEPTAEGGWVATFEDITARIKTEGELSQARASLIVARAEAERAADEARAAHARLRDAFEVVPEGLALFDAEDRYVLWNRRYEEIYDQSGGLIVAGMRFEDALRAGLARGQYPEAAGREEEWLAERIEQHQKPRANHEQRLSGDRWMRIEERRTADGGSIGIRVDITDLKRREASFKLLFQSNPVPMWVYDCETLRILAVNQAVIDHYGHDEAKFLTMTVLDMKPVEEHDRFRMLVGNQTSQPSSGRVWRHFKADGSLIEVAIYARALVHDGRHARLAAAIDVTESRRQAEEVRRTREFLDRVVENVPTTLIVKDARDMRYVLVNRAGEELFGVPRDKIIGRTAADLFPAEVAAEIMESDRKLLRGCDDLPFEDFAIETPGNGERLVRAKRLVLPGEAGERQYVLSVVEDVTERKRAEERVAHLAFHDALTGLPNRRAFTERLAAMMESDAREPFAIVSIDLDRFKEVNDVFGHMAGDTLLREVSRRLVEASDGAFLARLGGDEFTLIVHGGEQPTLAAAICDQLMTAVKDDLAIDGHHLRVGLSLGVAIYPTDGADAATLLANADAALYRAKAEGRGTMRFFEADMDKRLRERRALHHDLRSAIEHGELAVHYQPQAGMGREIVGFEALARWRHPTRGLVSPDVFIPAAEESGFITEIGEWILREVCREAVTWARPLQVAVNLSPVQFRHGDLARTVHAILLETGLPARRLELEITEGVLLGDTARSLSTLRRLKALGVRIAMDDFGTGYSSLSYLQSFPFDRIKIDRTFIANVERNPQSAAIIRAVIGLARGLNMPVIAEGVETEDQLNFLASEACNEVQGYLIGRPRPIDDYAGLVGRARAPAAMTRRA